MEDISDMIAQLNEETLHRDAAGNRLIIEGKKIGVRNRQGKLVSAKDVNNFIKREGLSNKIASRFK